MRKQKWEKMQIYENVSKIYEGMTGEESIEIEGACSHWTQWFKGQ